VVTTALLLWLVRYAVAPVALKPVVVTVTACEALPVLIICTETEPSVFLNALVLRPEGAPDVATRIAPGRTDRLHCAKAQSLPEGLTVVPEIWMRPALLVVISIPSQ
jgi:hypothetical protein